MSCKTCNGEGVIETEKGLSECYCSVFRRLEATLPAFIRMTPIMDAHFKLPVLSHWQDSVFLISRWSDSRAIIKILMMRHCAKVHRITSDREIKEVYVGAHSKSSRDDDDSRVVFNTIQDLMEFPDLVFVRLNEIKNPNKAAAGALEEALTLRADRGKPTWVITDPMEPFGVTSYAYSSSVWDLLSTVFRSYTVPAILSGGAPPPSEFKVDTPTPKRAARKVPHPDNAEPENSESSDDGLGGYGLGKKPPRDR